MKDTEPRMDEARSKRWKMGIGIIALLTVLQVVTLNLAGHPHGRSLAHLLLLLTEVPFLMVVFSLGFRFTSRAGVGVYATVLGGIVVASVVGALFGFAIWHLAEYFPELRPRVDTPWRLSRAVLFGVVNGHVDLGLWTLAFVFPFALEDARLRSLSSQKLTLETEKLRLEAEKLRTTAELERLRAHLEPHFLLNTLSAIAGLVTDDPREARRLLVCLGDLLRDALRSEAEMQNLDDQVRWLERYAEILEARHRGRLVFHWDVSSEARDGLLPQLLLQPLVENAIKHGALRATQAGEVTVRASVVHTAGEASPSLVCVIEDNGPGMSSERIRSGAFGLRAVRRRLELKYGDAASLDLSSSSEGTRATVHLPYFHNESVARAS